MKTKNIHPHLFVNRKIRFSAAIKSFLGENSFEICRVMGIFVLAFCIRLLFWKHFGTLFSAIDGDSIEYYITSINYEPNPLFKIMYGYEHWYQRTPVYIIFLHLIQRQLIVQVILSSAGCAIMYRLNKLGGLLWTIYLQDIIHSFQYNKESLLVFIIIVAIYFFKNHKNWLVIIIPVIILGFVSYAWVTNGQHSAGTGMMKNFWALWQPSFNISIGYGKIFVYLQFLPYVAAMLYFIRHVKILSPEFGIFLILSLAYGIIYAEPRFREPFMPLLFLFIAEPLKLFLKNNNPAVIINNKFKTLIRKKKIVITAGYTKRF